MHREQKKMTKVNAKVATCYTQLNLQMHTTSNLSNLKRKFFSGLLENQINGRRDRKLSDGIFLKARANSISF